MDDLKTALEAIRQKHNVPALSAAITVDGVQSEAAVTGLRRVDQPDNAICDDDLFHFGSCGKAVTASIIHSLADEGKLSLDTTLSSLFPDAPLHDKYKDVTIAQILTHSAGMPEMPGVTPTEEQFKDSKWLNSMLSDAAKLPAMLGQLSDPPKYENGAHYSNFGYTLLGHIAEKVSGKPFEDLVRERIFEPLDMKSAGFGIPQSATAAIGHRDGKPQETDVYPKEFASAGLMHASTPDWLKFVTWDMQQQRVTNPTAKAPMQIEDGTTVQYTDSALMDHGHGVYSHAGSNGINLARQQMIPKLNSAFVVVANEGGPSAQAAIGEATEMLNMRMIDQLLEKRAAKEKPAAPKWTDMPRNQQGYQGEGMVRKPPSES